MIILEKIFKASIGQKILVALTGLGLGFFVLGHMAGNLSMWLGRDAMNSYAEGMQSLGALLWVARGGLIVTLLVHVIFAIKLTAANKSARPVKYKFGNTVQASLASRTMIYTGLLILGFILFHLMHFTIGNIDPAGHQVTEQVQRLGATVTRHDAYGMVVSGFSNVGFAALYIVMMIILASHLSHGFASLFQSLGLVKQTGYALLKKAAIGLTWVIILGFISIPVGVLAGLIK